MKYLWQNYLDQLFDTSEISDLVVYTDQFRYWFASGLIDLAEELDWGVSLQLIEEITDEEGMEIRHGLSTLSDSTLLVAIFSDRNPIISELTSIFPLLSGPLGYRGKSIVTQIHLSDQFLPIHLQTDLFAAEENENELRRRLKGNIALETQNGGYLEVTITSVASYPFIHNNHILFPSTELVVEIEPSSFDGTIVVNQGIGAYFELEELIDPFGKITTPIEILVESGKIVEIKGNQIIKRRLEGILRPPYIGASIQLSFGLGQKQENSGFIDHDRLGENILTISWIDKNNNLLEFVVGTFSFVD